MQTTFLNAAGAVLFTRDDMEQGNWTQEEYTVNATFPYVAGKVIQRGQRISFRDPATDAMEFFEIRNVTNIEPEHYQQIIAEHIAVSELSDEHINNKEITDKTPAQALQTALTGTLWAVGNSSATNVSSADIGRGSVWQAVNTIATNWNVYIVPRVTVNNGGAITGRYLDIMTTTGVFRGMRLSIDKNMSDSSVVYDDSEVLTALYGYGGNVDVAQTGGDDEQAELTFADVVWSATSEHPAKPAGQTYLEDPAKTALYGRNGRARFGYYQNGDITDPNVLLQKTWESLKETSSPKISITGTVSDLYRLGYKDEPIRLHDKVCVEIRQTGEKFNLQVIRLDLDLIDPTATRPDIGAYIPNIIYINRDTNESATAGGGGGGGGGGRGQKNQEYKDAKTFATMQKSENMIGMVVGTKNGNNYIKGGEITISINEQDASTRILLKADVIDIDGVVTALEAYDISCGALTCGLVTCQGIDNGENGIQTGGLTVGAEEIILSAGSGLFSGNVDCTSLTVNNQDISTKSKTVVTAVNKSNQHYFLYSGGSGQTTPTGTTYGQVVTSVETSTIYYLGY
jgi:phage minor structural protein